LAAFISRDEVAGCAITPPPHAFWSARPKREMGYSLPVMGIEAEGELFLPIWDIVLNKHSKIAGGNIGMFVAS
jgi:hypothetical protein